MSAAHQTTIKDPERFSGESYAIRAQPLQNQISHDLTKLGREIAEDNHMNEYKAIYDAVRSRISDCNIGQVITDLSFYAQQASRAAQDAAGEYTRPSVLYRPTLKLDGNEWIALYGENLQEGVVGTGRSPEEAMRDFDLSWHKKQPAVLPQT